MTKPCAAHHYVLSGSAPAADGVCLVCGADVQRWRRGMTACIRDHEHADGYHCYPQPVRLSDKIATAVVFGVPLGAFIGITTAWLLDR